MATKERAYLANKNWRMLTAGTAKGELFVAPHKSEIDPIRSSKFLAERSEETTIAVITCLGAGDRS
jgi:hypothetical protein